ncbi:MAG: hypothetical protein IN818_07650 [Cutibacterium sp.]|nr:hypothetical protein [Cutibacterium sp.]
MIANNGFDVGELNISVKASLCGVTRQRLLHRPAPFIPVHPGDQAGYIVFRSQGRFLVPIQSSVFLSPSRSASWLSEEP